jgi:hypothetical protein
MFFVYADEWAFGENGSHGGGASASFGGEGEGTVFGVGCSFGEAEWEDAVFAGDEADVRDGSGGW